MLQLPLSSCKAGLCSKASLLHCLHKVIVCINYQIKALGISEILMQRHCCLGVQDGDASAKEAEAAAPAIRQQAEKLSAQLRTQEEVNMAA